MKARRRAREEFYQVRDAENIWSVGHPAESGGIRRTAGFGQTPATGNQNSAQLALVNRRLSPGMAGASLQHWPAPHAQAPRRRRLVYDDNMCGIYYFVLVQVIDGDSGLKST